jgi:diaminopimelate decarboxylase
MQRGFTRVEGTLHCEGVSLRTIAEQVGTPSYVYSAAVIREQYSALTNALKDALGDINFRIHYAVKANSSLALLNILRELGAGVDIVSGGELFRSQTAGFAGADVVFSGVGKTEAEIESALRAGVKMINVESPAELYVVNAVAERLGVVAPIAFRVNPDVSVDTPHPYTRTGEHGMKFGIPDDQVLEVVRVAMGMQNVSLVGIAAHLGSQISQSEPYAITARQLIELRNEIVKLGVTTLKYLDVGGGLGVTYDNEAPLDVAQFAQLLAPIVRESGLELVLEPGRYLVANAGVLLARVIYRKRSGGKEIIITDSGMNDLIRPSLYEAYHAIDSVDAPQAPITADIVGPVCESGDFFALDRVVSDVPQGGFLAVRSAGAYGYVMASNYNTRPRPAEVLVDGDRYAVITRRETYQDLIDLETLTPTWNEA